MEPQTSALVLSRDPHTPTGIYLINLTNVLIAAIDDVAIQ